MMRDIEIDSLHRLKDHAAVKNKRHMSEAAGFVEDNLDGIISATQAAVHVRSRQQGFQLSAESTRLSPHQLGYSKANPGAYRPSLETFLEFAVLDACKRAEMNVGMPWHRVVGRQVPLMAKQQSDGWGAIDLLGLDADGRPVVIELKKASSTETPLRAVLEAAGYAISIEANWRVLSEEIHRLPLQMHTAGDPRPLALTIAAPSTYWRGWERWSTTGRGVPKDTRDSLRRVVQALETRGLVCTFVEVSHDEWDESSPLEGESIRLALLEPWA